MSSDRLEGEFGVIRQLSGGNYYDLVEQVLSSLSLRRLKFYHDLELHSASDMMSTDRVCCMNVQDKDEDLELIDECFERASELSESERSAIFYICGYVVFKESIPTVDDLENCPESEFTKLVSRGKLKYPPPELFDLALYMYTYFKWREPKCCSKIFELGFKIIYDSSGCHFTDIEKILKRFVNCFCKGYAKEKTDQIKQKDKITHTERKKRKFRSR